MALIKIPVEVEISEQDVANLVSKTVGSYVNEAVQAVVKNHLYLYQNTINEAVEVYLDKRLTAKDIKDEIDNTVKRIISEKIEDGEL